MGGSGVTTLHQRKTYRRACTTLKRMLAAYDAACAAYDAAEAVGEAFTTTSKAGKLRERTRDAYKRAWGAHGESFAAYKRAWGA